jgi:hypothetical protein
VRAGRRVAVNIQGLDCTDAPRGATLTSPQALLTTRRARVLVELLGTAPARLQRGGPVRLHQGTCERAARLRVVGKTAAGALGGRSRARGRCGPSPRRSIHPAATGSGRHDRRGRRRRCSSDPPSPRAASRGSASGEPRGRVDRADRTRGSGRSSRRGHRRGAGTIGRGSRGGSGSAHPGRPSRARRGATVRRVRLA